MEWRRFRTDLRASRSDVNVVYSRTQGNIERLAEVLSPFKPRLRGAPAGLPFTWDAKTIHNGLNFHPHNNAWGHRFLWRGRGQWNLQQFTAALCRCRTFDLCFKCIDLPTLIRIKEAAGRPKDREAIAELRVLLQETEQRQS